MQKYSKIKISSNRSFGLIFFIFFLIISLWSFRGDYSQIKIIPFFIAFIFLVLGLINSKILSPLNLLWFKFGLFLGSIIAPIIMGFIFFTVITPTGIIMKIIGKDLLNKKKDKNKKSYWINRSKSKTTMKEQF
jgi:hypothetical protein|tara:strand:+ start:315 stop:713 length:399 start_codon:yes stop_codon:yes gene_type:complete